MKYKLIGLSFLSFGVLIAVCLNMNFVKPDNGSWKFLANVEALAKDEVNHCPRPTDVPNRYIESSGPRTATYQSNSSGEINVGGVIHGGYSKNTSVSITVETFNCDGIQEGACCDQRKVGTFPI